MLVQVESSSSEAPWGSKCGKGRLSGETNLGASMQTLENALIEKRKGPFWLEVTCLHVRSISGHKKSQISEGPELIAQVIGSEDQRLCFVEN